jgi:hemerythrin-like domain-containing protein
MCEHCGCRGVEPIAELMDEHYALLDEAHLVRRALAAGDRPTALTHLRRLVAHLEVHVGREEHGIFAALREQGEFLDEVHLLEREHVGFDAGIAALDPSRPDLEHDVSGLLRELDDHVERENLGIFPVSVVTLARRVGSWSRVRASRSRRSSPAPPHRRHRTPRPMSDEQRRRHAG